MAAKIVKLHHHTGKTRTVHVAFCVVVCARVPVDVVKSVVQDLLAEAGASTRSIRSVTAVAQPNGTVPS